jgi:hypothetical protein
VEIAHRANYDHDNGVPDPLDANHPIQATNLREMHDRELLRRAQYDQDSGSPDDLYVIPTTYTPASSPGAINNFLAFSQRLKMIIYPKDFNPAIEKYDGCSDPSIWLKMYNITARVSGGNEDHMAGYFLFCDRPGATPVARQSPCGVHHLVGDLITTIHNQLSSDLQPP